MFTQNMDSDLYKEIIMSYFIPFVAAKFNFCCKIHQDNARTHTSYKCESALYNFNIDWVKIRLI